MSGRRIALTPASLEYHRGWHYGTLLKETAHFYYIFFYVPKRTRRVRKLQHGKATIRFL